MNTFFAFGDAPFFFEEQLLDISWLPRVWDESYAFGRSIVPQLWIDYPIRLLIKIAHTLGFSWWSIDKMLWISAVIIAIFSIWKLSQYIFHSRWISTLSVGIYSMNTYVLMLFDGGQRGVMLAYSLVPYIVYRCLSLIDDIFSGQSIRHSTIIHNGLLFAALIALDLRLAYLACGVFFAYGIFSFIWFHKTDQEKSPIFFRFISTFLRILSIAFLLHCFWILPMLFVRSGIMIGEEYTGLGMLSFLSVSDFSHALSFLHPNWPENIFGKVYFLQPEFLIIPIVAFGSLFGLSHVNQSDNRVFKYVIFFAAISLLGAFFAKGVQEPFGGVFAWAFRMIPGFVMFRDPTKFYLYISLGYSLLIPYTLHLMSKKIDSKPRLSIGFNNSFLNSRIMLSVIFILFWMFTIRSLLTGELKGNLMPKPVPAEYVQLKNSLITDSDPSRVLWLPTAEKFSYASDTHPIITSETLFDTASISGIVAAISSAGFTDALYTAGIKYIVIPTDEWHRIFLREYIFDSTIREQIIQVLQSKNLVRDHTYSKLAVFKNNDYHFTSVKPSYVALQEKWMRRGLSISVLSLLMCGIALWKLRKKVNHDRIKK